MLDHIVANTTNQLAKFERHVLHALLQQPQLSLRSTLSFWLKSPATRSAPPDKQVSLTDPDDCSMMTGGTGIFSYNVRQRSITQHHLIVAQATLSPCSLY